MSYKLIISPAAIFDTTEAFTYYETNENNLGEQFISELEQHYQKLQDHPTYYSYILIEHNIRSIALKKFPYAIIYEIDNDQVNVFAVHHMHRNPEHYIKRITK